MISKEYKENIRIYELDYLIKHIKGAKSLLELGAGAGWQAKKLSELGLDVKAIDVEQTTFRNIQVYDVEYYDGENIPIDDHSFDVVFSSNVLEHIPSIDVTLKELHRVLRNDGVAVHFLPNFNWRLWTTLTHFPNVLKRLVNHVFSNQNTSSDLNIESKYSKNDSGQKFLNFLLPGRHGERGNVITEMYFFSRVFWRKKMTENDWQIESVYSIPLFHSGNYLLSDSVSIKFRNFLGRIIGGTTDVYVIKKAK
jgi:SAM-dependent methyltransferase